MYVDVSEPVSTKAMIDHALNDFGKIEILVNNAGVTRDNLIIRTSEADWDTVLNINLKGAFNCSKAVIRTMMKQPFVWWTFHTRYPSSPEKQSDHTLPLLHAPQVK